MLLLKKLSISSFPATTCAVNTSTCEALIFGRYGFHMGIMAMNAGTISGVYFTTPNINHTTAAITVSTGQWYHIAMVVNNTTKSTQMYLNGKANGAASSFAGLTLLAYGTARSFQIGRADSAAPLTNGNYAYPFTGIVDEAVIWNTALTATQIKGIYDQQSCGKN